MIEQHEARKEKPMKRPYTYCLINVTLNGKVAGPAFATKATNDAGETLASLGWGANSYYKATSWL